MEDKYSCGPDEQVGVNLPNEKASDQRFKLPSMSSQTVSSKNRRLQYQYAPPSYIGEAINKLDNVPKNLSFGNMETEFDI